MVEVRKDFFFFFQAEDGIRDIGVTGVQTCALPICQVPSGWTGPSHLLIKGPPYRQPALAGGAMAISPAAISRATDPPTMQRFMVVSLTSPLGRCRVLGVANTVD